jgi:hypothetical protein
MVEVFDETDLLAVEGLGAVHIRHRERYQLEPVVHGVLPLGSACNALIVNLGRMELLYKTAT